MKKFNSYEELGFTCTGEKMYCNEELSNFLNCEGSTPEKKIVNENLFEGYFTLENSDGLTFNVGVTHEEIDGELSYNYYWIDSI